MKELAQTDDSIKIKSMFCDIFNSFSYKGGAALTMDKCAKLGMTPRETAIEVAKSMKEKKHETKRNIIAFGVASIGYGLIAMTALPVFTGALCIAVSLKKLPKVDFKKMEYKMVDNRLRGSSSDPNTFDDRAKEIVDKHYGKRFKDGVTP